LLRETVTGKLIRIHGDFHLGQVLYTGKDLCVVDFDGEPARSRGERERLRSPLVDVASMMRSFHYAAYGTLSGELTGSQVRAQDRPTLVPWAAFHERWASTAFFSAYLTSMSGSGLLPDTAEELRSELELYLLEKALYEIVYELGTRPHWVELPLRGALDALGS
jgi:maltose alpha-D-glucosyltransferase/alpha-amylase